MTHTPLPWKLDPDPFIENSLVGSDGRDIIHIYDYGYAACMKKDDTEFVMKAVNSLSYG